MKDPTRAEMMAVLVPLFRHDTDGHWDYEEAMYWFANDYHGGQTSNLYSALSTSEYRPGPITTGCEPETISAMMYECLERAFIGNGP